MKNERCQHKNIKPKNIFLKDEYLKDFIKCKVRKKNGSDSKIVISEKSIF